MDDRRSGAATATPEAPAVQDGEEARRISHWIGGRATPGRSGRSGHVFDPAAGRVQAEVDLASEDEVDAAVAAAREAFPAWRATSL